MLKKSNKFSFRFKFPEFLLLILILISGVSLAFSSGSFIINLKTVGFSVLSTAQRGIESVATGFSNTFGAVKELGRLKKEYDELTIKLEKYEQMRRSNVDIKKENERLKEQLGFATSLEEKNYPAQIIGRETDNLNSYLTINKGSSSGIKKNMPVIAYQKGELGLVGKIIQVGTFSSIVMPIYNSNCSISTRIQNTRDLGLVTGNGSEDVPLSMSYIRKRVLDELHIGDVIVTSGENNNYMKDIPVGAISKVTVIDYNSSLDIELTPIVDFSRLENVIVVNQKEINDTKRR